MVGVMVCVRDSGAGMLWAGMSMGATRSSASTTTSESIHHAGFNSRGRGSRGGLDMAASSESHL